jgi:hypothetical protein
VAVLSEVQFAVINTTAATATLVAAQAAGVKIRVVALFLVNTAAQTVTFKSGAGGTAITGPLALGVNAPLALQFNPQGWFETAAAQLLEIANSGATQVSGSLAWVAVS